MFEGGSIESGNYVVDMNKLVRFRLLLLQNQLMGLSFRREGSPMKGNGDAKEKEMMGKICA